MRLFTLFLLLARRPAVVAAASLLCVLVALGQLVGFRNLQLLYWSDPIILEFVAGMVMALCFAAGITLGAAARLGLVVLGVAAFHFATFAPPAWRALVYGLPAVALLSAAALGRVPDRLNAVEVLLVRLGDAS
jgi:exopolysaccharide production protein ExoZ